MCGMFHLPSTEPTLSNSSRGCAVAAWKHADPRKPLEVEGYFLDFAWHNTGFLSMCRLLSADDTYHSSVISRSWSVPRGSQCVSQDSTWNSVVHRIEHALWYEYQVSVPWCSLNIRGLHYIYAFSVLFSIYIARGSLAVTFNPGTDCLLVPFSSKEHIEILVY